VDFFWYDDAGDRIIIAQAKFTASPKARDLVAFPGCLNWISKPEALQQEGLGDLADAAIQLS
jgi:hypothetical protein